MKAAGRSGYELLGKYTAELGKEDSLPSIMTNRTTTATKDLEIATLFNK